MPSTSRSTTNAAAGRRLVALPSPVLMVLIASVSRFRPSSSFGPVNNPVHRRATSSPASRSLPPFVLTSSSTTRLRMTWPEPVDPFAIPKGEGGEYVSPFVADVSTTSSASVPPAAAEAVEGRGGEVGGVEEAAAEEAKEVGEPEEEWTNNATDPASTTPQLLAALWFMISQAVNTMERGETMTTEFPNMATKEYFGDPSYLTRLTGHLDACKDVCESFGIDTVLVPYAPDPNMGVTGFTVKSYRNPDKAREGDDDYEFDPDPFWDDVTDDDFAYIQELADEGDEEDEEDAELFGGGAAATDSSLPEIENEIPDDDEEIIQVTRHWVDKMMSDLALCPFTNGPDLSGMPMGKVYYTVDRCESFEDMYASYWREVVRVEQTNEKELSTTLLVAPQFCMDNVEAYQNFCDTLTQPLEVLAVEDLLQLVFFHPKWSFRDGGDRSGGSGAAAANYARRSPWPMINVLRTNQVRAAQKGIPTGLVYKQNERTLGKIGTKRLETMLRLRDWTTIGDEEKVDRREMEALRVAKDLQTKGHVAVEDMSLASDTTPAANKVEEGSIEGADMLNVLLQALAKRLGEDRHEGEGEARLTGPETSAAMMATDFLLERADELETV